MSHGRHKSSKRSSRHLARKSRRSTSGPSADCRRLVMEPLEDRCLLSVGLIRNGAFAGTVSPTDWATTGSFHADSRFSNYHSSPGYGYLSNADGSAGNNLIGEMSQQITIPSNSSSTILSYWYNITTQDTGSVAHDFLDVTVRNSSGVYVAVPGVYSNLNHTTGYQQATYDLSAFHGQTVTLDFFGTTDGSYPTVFRIDDVSVVASTVPHISGVNPTQPIVNAARQWIDIQGTGFDSTSTVTLYAGSTPYPIPADRTQYRSPTEIDVFVGLTQARSDWSATVTGTDGISPPLTFTVIPQAAQLPDLVVSAVSVNPTGVAAGGLATVTFTVANSGTAATPSTVATIRLGSVTTITDQTPLLTDVTVPTLGVGQFQTFNQSVAISSGTAAGSYYVGVTANDNGTVQESNSTNNQGLTPITVTSPKPVVFSSNSAPVIASGAAQTLTISGENFDPNATVTFRDPSGNITNATILPGAGTAAISVSQTFASVGQWAVTVANSTLATVTSFFNVFGSGQTAQVAPANGSVHINQIEFLQAYQGAFDGSGLYGTWLGGPLTASEKQGLSTLLNFFQADPGLDLGQAVDREWVAYMLATVQWETGYPIPGQGRTMLFQASAEEVGHGAGYPYGIPDPVTHQTYYGRGYVQLTGKAATSTFHLAPATTQALRLT